MVSFMTVLGEQPASPPVIRLVLTHLPPFTAIHWEVQCTAASPPPSLQAPCAVENRDYVIMNGCFFWHMSKFKIV